MAIRKISNDTIQRMKEKSVEKLPNIVKNISPQELKKRFTGIILDSDTSVVDEVNRIVDEINDEIIVINENIGNKKEIHISENEPEEKKKNTIWFKVY